MRDDDYTTDTRYRLALLAKYARPHVPLWRRIWRRLLKGTRS